MKKRFAVGILAATCLVSTPMILGDAAHATASNDFSFFVDAPSVQGSYVTGTTETFDAGCTTTWAMGTTDIACTGMAADTWGGASTTTSTPTRGGTATPYGSVWNGAPVTLTLTQPAHYFGIYWSAGDGANQIDFYNGDTLVGSFSFTALVDALNHPTLNGVEGATYDTADYYGNPVDGSNSGEPYAYLHVLAPSGASFDKVVLSEPGGGGFEFDNVTVATETQEVGEGLVQLSGPEVKKKTVRQTLPDTGLPTPAIAVGATSLLALGAAVMFFARRRRS